MSTSEIAPESSTEPASGSENGNDNEAPFHNPYLVGNYAPVADEVTAVDLPVEGELPAELNGRYVRNGPNPIGEVDPALHHWFVGDGMVHGICLQEGRAAWYRNRYVGSANVSAARGVDDIPGPNWSGNPGGANTHVAGFAGSTWATVEAGGSPVQLDYELETIGRNDFFGTLPGAFTAHAKFDPDTAELHAMAYCVPRWGDRVQYLVVGADGRVRRSAFIQLPGITMLHDIAISGRYALLFDQPVTVDFDLAFSGYFPFKWNPDYGNRVGLLDRTASFDTMVDDITWIDVPPGYAFHPMNAYDTVDADGTTRVTLDICNYDRMFDTDNNGPFEMLPRLERWELNPGTRTSSITVIDDDANEFPRHRGSLTGKPYRYGYTASISHTPGDGWQTVKHDLETGQRQVLDHGPGVAAGESVFVARDGSTAEDDGWLLTYLHDQGAGTASFVVMDAQDLERGYVAKVELPQRVPFGFHGSWISDAAVPPPPPPPPAPGASDEASDEDAPATEAG
jgi:carotenoid cleavage dioxygenase